MNRSETLNEITASLAAGHIFPNSVYFYEDLPIVVMEIDSVWNDDLAINILEKEGYTHIKKETAFYPDDGLTYYVHHFLLPKVKIYNNK